jgi:hypothetical protein
VPVHVPFETVRASPTFAVPETAGGVVFTGAAALRADAPPATTAATIAANMRNLVMVLLLLPALVMTWFVPSRLVNTRADERL